MSRRACPELYPDPRPTRLLAPIAAGVAFFTFGWEQ